jgi:uncharacterized damage-inducible protein DinB
MIPATQALLAELEAESAATRRLLERVPADRLTWKPHEKSMTLGQLASHIAEAPCWVLSMVQPVFDFGAVAADYKPFAPADGDELLQGFDKNVEELTAVLSGKDDAFMREVWTMKNGDKVLMSAPREAAIRNVTLSHIIHHRGQLTVYLRLLDVPVPPTFGPTADFPTF